MLAYQKAESIKSIDAASGFDTLLIIAQSTAEIPAELGPFKTAVEQQAAIDKSSAGAPTVVPLTQANLAGGFKRVVFAPTGPLDRDYDDVRRFFDAGHAGIQRALKAGAESVLLTIAIPRATKGVHSMLQSDVVGLLGALHALYVPLEIREARLKPPTSPAKNAAPEKPKSWEKLTRFGFHTADSDRLERVLYLASVLETAKCVTRDIQGSDPERMAPPRVAEYLQGVFGKSEVVKLTILDDQDKIATQYPCMGAVNRAARSVKRHQGRVVYLEYKPAGGKDGNDEVQETLCLVGKGICYDTGGADIKAGGIMAGMHRDKGGAAAISGFFKVLEQLRPRNIHVIAALAFIRNSVGEEGYVADEIITARSGKRVRVGNTDAEGRMVMVDLLCEMRERIVSEQLPRPQCYTIATLTGHAVLTVGEGYTIALDNGPAARDQNAQHLQTAGAVLGEPVEISTIRREDYSFHMGKSEYEDLLQCNNLPSSRTPRGHQGPAAFLIMGSGLDAHGIDGGGSEANGGRRNVPVCYTHLDIAASEGPFPGIPMAAPVLALTGRYVLPHVPSL